MESTSSVIHSEDKLTIKQSLFFGLQSVLACNLFLGPIVIIAIMKLDIGAAAGLITATFFACGVATILQSGFLLRFQVVQGMTFLIIGAAVAIGMKAGWPTLMGSFIVGSIFLMIVGVTGVFSKIIKWFVPGLVAGTVITVVGIALMPITFNSILMIPGKPSINFLEAFITFAAFVLFMRLGHLKNAVGRYLGLGSVIYAIIVGTIFAGFFGHVDFGPVAKASWIAIPKLMPYGMPKFDLNTCVVMCILMLLVMIESSGTWFTYTAMSGEKLDEKRINRGVLGEGLGCLIGSFFGALPVTSYASNAGVLAVTRVFSRHAAIGAGVIAVVMAFCPKLMYVIALVPSSVIWGVYAIICVAVTMSGLSSLRAYPLTERNYLVIGTSILTTIGAGLIPMPLIMSLPPLLGYMLSSTICVGALTAVIMNKVLREKAEDRAAEAAAEGSPAVETVPEGV
ncbi:uracil-xanthine permease family protein [Holophaga foetida]|uniref:uracil-xanthine permease family protein n=1 Tax=Holophaga foetida TaxID=35839 RepID=UPI000247530D|nr:solute carrier family 23 protein [Holophaga foetida]